ncbi:MAG TPA: hypothetical protein VL025_07620 [Thermoanaerobaculia bacterium]|nr:hypothetical protein [Thermoanaerobaculia bacterium]
MTKEKLYLRPNVVAEPLVDHWYAWSHLIPPVTAATLSQGQSQELRKSK